MNVLLVIFTLNVQSSYAQNVERDADPASKDTVQFLLIEGQAWRIKTYAIDHDVHVWSIGPMTAEKLEELARTNTAKNYADVLGETIVVKSASGFDGLREQLKKNGLSPNLEIPKSGAFAFWVQEAGVYKSRSTPK